MKQSLSESGGYNKDDHTGVENQYCKPVMYGTFIVQESQTTTTQVNTQQVSLNNGVSAILPFTWDTANFSKGSYTISARADTISGEIHIEDNTRIGGNVTVAMIGDITGPIPDMPDGKVDREDVATLETAYGSYPGHPRWNPNADINGDNKIDVRDLSLIGKKYGKTDT